MLSHITIGYGQAIINVTTNQAGMTESVIVGGCVRTLLFTITGLCVMVYVHVVLQKLKGVPTLLVVFVRGGDSLGKKE